MRHTQFTNGFHQLKPRSRRDPGYADLLAWALCAVAVLKIIGGW